MKNFDKTNGSFTHQGPLTKASGSMDGLLATSLIDHAAVNAAIAPPTAPAGKAQTMDVDSATLSFNPGTAVDPNLETKANAADAKAPCPAPR